MVIQDDKVHGVNGKQRPLVTSAKALVRVLIMVNVFTYLFVKVSGREVCFEPALWILIGIVICEATLLLHLVIFVVSGIDDD